MFTEAEASQIAAKHYHITGTATRLPGEYDANYHFKTDAGAEYLLKISRPEEDFDVIDLQNTILQCIEKSNADFAAPRLISEKNGSVTAQHKVDDKKYFVRLFSFLPGQLFAKIPQHSAQLLTHLGVQLGGLCTALTSVNHHAAKRQLKWDLKQYHWIHDHIAEIAHQQDRAIVEYFFQQFSERAASVLPTLRHSIIHGDVNDYNIIAASDHQIAGFIDFGDAVESATICELAIALAYIMMDKPDPLAAAVQVIRGFNDVFPLQDAEISILFDLVCLRLCVSVVNSALRKKENPDDAYLVISERPAWDLLRKLRSIHARYAEYCFREACSHHAEMPGDEILKERTKYLAKNLSLAYQAPLHIVRGSGQYLYDVNGRRYLDMVNNVCHVGHCHPRVVAAGQRQMAELNTNTRYLHENIIQYAKRLTAKLPPHLEVCFFVNSGSEANELALRLAAAHTRKNEWLVMDHGYYGNTETLIKLSPYKFNGKGGKGKAADVHVLPQPSSSAVEIPEISNKIAAVLCEAMPSCGGQVVLPPGYLQQVYAAVRAHGGVCIADEIQTGLGRMGTHFWAFETQNVMPDIVTMGKPLGNGHPIGAVVTTRAIAESFDNGMEYFNTFGGNPVSCAIGLAVLDVIEEEQLQQHAMITGEYLKQQLQQLELPGVTDVRGSGLFIGIECDTSERAKYIVHQIQENGILLSVDGPLQNVIKIKPPMVFNQQNVDEFIVSLTSR